MKQNKLRAFIIKNQIEWYKMDESPNPKRSLVNIYIMVPFDKLSDFIKLFPKFIKENAGIESKVIKDCVRISLYDIIRYYNIDTYKVFGNGWQS